MKYFLAIDCGLTKIKVNIFSPKGEKMFEEQDNTPLNNFEIDTKALREKIIFLIGQILEKSNIKSDEIVAISTSGHGNGVYLLDENGVLPVGYSSMFEASSEFTPPTVEVFKITNQTSWSGQPLPILSYLKHKKPELFGKIKTVLFCKDVIKYFITGRAVTEYTDASAAGLLNYVTADYDLELLKVYGLEDNIDIFPKILKSQEIIGNVSEEFAKLTGLSVNTAVIGGMFDVNACMLGAGVNLPGKYCIIAGTWGINSAVVDGAVSSQTITQCCNFLTPDRYMCIDSSPTSGANLEWFVNNVFIGMDYETADSILKDHPIDEKLLYLPYIFSASDIENQASFIGFKPYHTYKDMLRSVYEGIVFEHTRRIEKLKAIGINYDTAVLTGGAASSEMFCQMFADITGLKIETVKQSQTGSLGGVILASTAVGVYSDVSKAALEMVETQDIYYPREIPEYKEKYKLFKNTISTK